MRVCSFAVCVCMRTLHVFAEHYAHCVQSSMFLCVHINRCQSPSVFISPDSLFTTQTRGILLFSFLFRRLTLPQKLFIAFLPCIARHQLGWPLIKAAQQERGCRWKREYALGVLAVLSVRGRKERRDLLLENVSICA